MKQLFILFSMVISFTIAEAQSVGGNVTGDATVCASSNSGALTLSGQTGNVIRWQSSADGGSTWSNITNTTVTQNYSNLTTTTMYRAVVQQGTNPTANSNPATISVDDPSAGAVTASTSVCAGFNNGTLNLNGTFTSINYWKFSTDGGVTWNTIANTSASQSCSNLNTTTLYSANITNGTCPSADATFATITVNPVSVGGSVLGSDSVCAGSNSGTLTLNGQTGNVIRWQSSTDGGVTWSNISNTTAINNFSNLTQTTDFRAVVQSGTCSSANSASATIIIFPISVAGTVNSSATVCNGLNNGTLQLTGYTGNIINWEKSIDNGLTWIIIADSTDTLSYSNITVKTLYRATVQSGACLSKKSTIATISVNTPSAGGTVMASDTVCSGSNSGTLQLTGYVGNIVRWQSSTDGGVSWSDISNTNALYNYVNITATTNYRAVVQNGSCAASNSSDATITIFPISGGGTLAPVNYTACSGINNGTIVLSGQSGNVYSWEYSIDGGVTWNTIANTSTSQNFQNLSVTTKYRAIVQNRQCTPARSDISTISVFPPSVGGNVLGNDTVCKGTNNGSLILNGFTGSILHWESSADGGATWTTISNTTAIQNYTNLAVTTMYRAVVQSGSCSTANSASATIMVSPASIAGSVLSSKIICDSLTFGTLLLSGYTGNVLNWNKSIDGGHTWITIADTTNTYIYSNIATESMFRAIVQNGACSATPSAPATISLALPAHASFSVTVNGATAIFTNKSVSNNGSSIWNFGDNTTSPITNPAHTYTANGSYLVQLIIKDSCRSDSATEIINITGVGISEIVYNNPNIIITPNPFHETAVMQIANANKNMNYELKMYSIYGKEVSVDVIRNADGFLLHKGDLANGIYFYKLQNPDSGNDRTTGETIAAGKIVIQ